MAKTIQRGSLSRRRRGFGPPYKARNLAFGDQIDVEIKKIWIFFLQLGADCELRARPIQGASKGYEPFRS